MWRFPNREEYLNSEKYQFKERDWNAPGNIKAYLTQLNRIRKENRALQNYENLEFNAVENDQILSYSKATSSLDNIILVAVSLDPFHMQSGFAYVPIDRFGIGENETYQVEDLLTSERFVWRGRRNFVMLDPNSRPAHIFRVRRQVGKDGGQTVYR